MFLLKFLNPELLVKLFALFMSSGSLFSLLAVGLFNKKRTIDFAVSGERYTFALRSRGDLAIVFEMLFLDVYPTELFEKDMEYLLDLGAHIGIAAILFSKRLKPRKIFALEPVSDNYQLLIENVRLNQLEGKIVPIHAGIGADDGSIDIFRANSTNSHSIVFGEGAKNTERISLQSLSSIAERNGVTRFDLIKMDIEGYEYAVIDSMLPYICNAKILTMERHDVVDRDFETDISLKILGKGFQLMAINLPGPVYTFGRLTER